MSHWHLIGVLTVFVGLICLSLCQLKMKPFTSKRYFMKAYFDQTVLKRDCCIFSYQYYKMFLCRFFEYWCSLFGFNGFSSSTWRDSIPLSLLANLCTLSTCDAAIRYLHIDGPSSVFQLSDWTQTLSADIEVDECVVLLGLERNVKEPQRNDR